MSYKTWQSSMRWKRRHEMSRTTNTDQGGYVYVLYLGYEDVYKIGKTRSVSGRLKSLTAANPRASAVILSRVVDINRCEATLHRRFRKYRLERECFRLDNNHLNAIRAYLDRNSPAA